MAYAPSSNYVPDELMRHIFSSVEVVGAWWVKWEVWVRATTVIPAIVRHTAYIPEGPARGGWSPWDVACIRLKEIDLVQRVRVTSTAQQCEENEQDGAGHEEQAQEAQCSSYGSLVSNCLCIDRV